MTKKLLRVIFLWLGLVITAPVLASGNPWSILINIPECRLYLYYDFELYKTFKVAVGRFDSPSPVGEFQIINKVLNPTWYPEGKPAVPPGTFNPLGKYWLGLNNKGYGIHGNSAAWSIGFPASRGCFRMDNHDIKELFDIVPVGTTVDIVYLTVKCKTDNQNQAWLEIFPDIYNRVNLEEVIRLRLDELNWIYRPHLQALSFIVKQKKPLKTLVPRVILFGGDCQNSDLDGFYWNDQIYLSQKMVLDPSIRRNDDNQFEGYFSLDPFDKINGAWQKLVWDQSKNTLIVQQFKVFFNESELNRGGRFGNGHRILIDLSQINRFLEPGQYQELVTAALSGSGEMIDGTIWVNLDTLIDRFVQLNYQWDETTWTLKIHYYPN